MLHGIPFLCFLKPNHTFLLFSSIVFFFLLLLVYYPIYVPTLALISPNNRDYRNLSKILSVCFLIFLYVILRSFFDATFSCVAYTTSILVFCYYVLICRSFVQFFFLSNPLCNSFYVLFRCYYDASRICRFIITEYQTVARYPNFFFLHVVLTKHISIGW